MKTKKTKSNYLNIFLILFSLSIVFFSCKTAEDQALDSSSETVSNEYKVREIPLLGSASKRYAELSGLTWYGDYLILLPQYPFKFGDKNIGKIFKIDKSKILDFINRKDTTAIEPDEININTTGLERFNGSDQGYESIAFNGNEVYLTIEADENSKMKGYVVKGTINPEATEIILDKNSLAGIEPQTDIYNLSDETIFIFNNQIYTVYEANGLNINHAPISHRFDLYLNPLDNVKFPNIEYRITDATIPNEEGKFWAINYMYSGDWGDFIPAFDTEDDSLSSARIERLHFTERLLEFQIKDSIIVRTERPPLKIELLNNNVGRNWEGLVKLENYGFLIVSDYFPRTILGFIEYKD